MTIHIHNHDIKDATNLTSNSLSHALFENKIIITHFDSIVRSIIQEIKII